LKIFCSVSLSKYKSCIWHPKSTSNKRGSSKKSYIHLLCK